MRNIVEGVIFLGIVALIVFLLPLPTFRLKIILTIFIGGPLGIFGVVGISNYSVTEYLSLWIKYKKNIQQISRKELFYTPEEKAYKIEQEKQKQKELEQAKLLEQAQNTKKTKSKKRKKG